MKVALVVAIKCDNIYLDEYISHYINLGFNKIIIVDNNEIDGEDPLPIISKYPNHTIYENRRGDHTPTRQWGYYNQMLIKYRSQFDFMCFFDDDEYLFLNNGLTSVNQWLSMPCFQTADVVAVNWKMYSDNNLVRYDPRPVTERFTELAFNRRMDNSIFLTNDHIKTIVNCKSSHILFFNHPHFAYAKYFEPFIAKNSRGLTIKSSFPFSHNDTTYAELRHYQFKSTEEFCQRRISTQRQTNNQRFDGSISSPDWEIEYYFKYNTPTKEKISFIKDYCKNNNIKTHDFCMFPNQNNTL